MGEILPKIKCLLKVEDPPNFLVLHCGGNNIPGDKGEKYVDLRLKINNILVSLAKLLPDTVLVWSQILPRQHWRGGVDQEAMDMVRKRLNSFVATALIRKGGGDIFDIQKFRLIVRTCLPLTEFISLNLVTNFSCTASNKVCRPSLQNPLKKFHQNWESLGHGCAMTS